MTGNLRLYKHPILRPNRYALQYALRPPIRPMPYALRPVIRPYALRPMIRPALENPGGARSTPHTPYALGRGAENV